MKTFLKILFLILWIAIAAGAVVLMGFSNNIHKEKTCTGMQIKIDHSGSDPLFTNAGLKQILEKTFGKTEHKSLADIDLERMMRFLRLNPAIDQVDAHITIEGRLDINVKQCKPIARLIDIYGNEHYLDAKGKILPANHRFPARVLIANGSYVVEVPDGSSIFTPEKNKNLQARSRALTDIHALSTYITQDNILCALIEQISVKPDGMIQLATKAGSHTIEFGDTSDMKCKFDNLKAFYRHGLSKTGWDKYHTINLMFKNQIVCTK
jgi:cell division protein FtsQ